MPSAPCAAAPMRLHHSTALSSCLRRLPIVQTQCRGIPILRAHLPCSTLAASRNYSISGCDYWSSIRFDSTLRIGRQRTLIIAACNNSRLNSICYEKSSKRFFSQNTAERKETNKNTNTSDGKEVCRHSLIELFRGSQWAKSLPAYSSLNQATTTDDSQPPMPNAAKSEGLQKKKAASSRRKKSEEHIKKTESEDSKINGEVVQESNASKISRGKKTKASKKSSTPKIYEKAYPVGKINVGKREMVPLFPPTGKSVMVVESATKAKTIQNYLGGMFDVLPTYGHVRDLAGRSGSVRPDDDFSMVWEVPGSAWTHLKSIKVALNGAKNLILATDPDREGEAIAWHLIEMLQQQDALQENINVTRVVFHEITNSAIKSALQTPRDLDVNLINAYLARRALDYLIGFSISPLLWRKLPGCQSAGRVQSAALALICDREMEIDQFNPTEYWSIEAGFEKISASAPGDGASIISELSHFDSKRLNQLSIGTCEEAESMKKRIFSSTFVVLGSKKGKTHRNPPMPYITSTLQQDSAAKFDFAAAHTMKLAQKLYEGVILSDEQATGLITYMRTDGLHISDAAAKDIHSLVIQRYGESYASKDVRKYFKKVKNAQEAHEAIRPTSIWRLPSSLSGILDDDSLKLYTLIWCRTVACQMEAAVTDTVHVDIGNPEKDIIFRSSGSKTTCLGYQAVYKDVEATSIGPDGNERNAIKEEKYELLSMLKETDQIYLKRVECEQHHTKPSGRYSEGSLVKKLEELGIGRPSTYAPILKVLKDRKYITVRSRTLHPEFRGRMVSAFLSHHFSEVSDYSFTADMENELDNVSAGTTEWRGLLEDYWSRFKKYCDAAGNVNIRQLEKTLEKKFGHILFGELRDGSRVCPSCLEGTLVFKISKFGSGYFIGCDQHPKCKYIAGALVSDDEDEDVPSEKPDNCFKPKLLGHNPNTNEKILLKKGPYGYYVQLGDDRRECPPKRTSLEGKDIDSLTLEQAIELLRYPITLGKHPEDESPVILSHSKYGFSVRHKRTIAPVPKSKDAKDVTLEVALKLLTSKKAKQTGRRPGKPKTKEVLSL